MDVKRVTSSLLGFPLVVIVILIGNKILVDIALTIIALISMNEYLNAATKVSNPVKWVSYLSCFLISFLHIIPKQYLSTVLVFSVPTTLLILFIQIIATEMRTSFKDIAYTFLGIFYVVFFIMFLALINGMKDGKILIWYVIFASWGTDIFAYVVGRSIGKHKFNKISPKKTIEGCIGGIIGAIVVVLIYTYVINIKLNMDYSYIGITVTTIILSIISQIGDFAASSIKRFVDIKDFSNLIPGHGGMLDRIFTAPFAYLLFTYIF